MSSVQYNVSFIGILSDPTKREITGGWLNIQPDFQREYELRPASWRGMLIQTIYLGRMMCPIWTVFNKTENSDEVLDGQHRLMTIKSFLQDEFAVENERVPAIHRKRFSELDPDDQQVILNYNIPFNKLGSEYRDNPDILYETFEMLNKASKPLNRHEVYKPLRLGYYELLAPFVERFSRTPLFREKKNHRGLYESRLTQILAIQDMDLEKYKKLRFSSQEDLKEDWCIRYVGSKAEEIRERFEKNKEKIERNLETLFFVQDSLAKHGMFRSDEGQDLVSKHTILIFMIVLGLTTRLYGTDLSLHPKIVCFVKDSVLPDLVAFSGCDSRDGRFQKACIHRLWNEIRNISRTS
jgi:hypothetical protein